MRVAKVFDAPWFKIIDATGAYTTPSAKVLMNRRFRLDYLGHAHPRIAQGNSWRFTHSRRHFYETSPEGLLVLPLSLVHVFPVPAVPVPVVWSSASRLILPYIWL